MSINQSTQGAVDHFFFIFSKKSILLYRPQQTTKINLNQTKPYPNEDNIASKTVNFKPADQAAIILVDETARLFAANESMAQRNAAR